MQITARRFTSLSAFPRSRRELFEVSDAALQSNNQWCWSSSVAVSSEPFTPQHRQKRVPKKERTKMVLAFVEKYRALNGGKFPSASCLTKQVGGSYYVLREIIQELKYNHKRESLENKKEVENNVGNSKCEDFSLTEVPFILADAKQSNKAKEGAKTSRLSIEAHSENLHASSSPSASVAVKLQKHISETMNADNQLSAKLETKTGILHTQNEERQVCRKDAASTANLQNVYCPEGKKKSDGEGFQSEEVYHEQQKTVEMGTLWTKRSNFWGNLKSMAFGIINLWKK